MILSPAFFAKNWTQYELDGLVQREMQGHKVSLPIWHNLGRDELMAHNPSLADKLALSSDVLDVREIAEQIFTLLEPPIG